ncbi:TPA: hypothetical protein ACG858_001654, partial [Enterococcus faecium]
YPKEKMKNICIGKFLPYRCFGLFFLFLFDHCHCSYPTRTCLLDLDRIATKFEACCWQFV